MSRSVSCTIFAYNEEQMLPTATREVHAALVDLGREFEILIVDDGSTDRTAEVAASLEAELDEVHVIRHGRNLGSGNAILTGIRNSRNDVICFHAADNQLDFAEVAQFIELLDDHDIVIGSRSGRPGYSKIRMLSSAVYIGLAQRLFGLGEWDDFNFLYLYRRELFEDMPIDSEGIFVCTEIFVRALDMGARVATVEATCKPREIGSSAVFKPTVIARTFYELARFWVRR
jgi:undecaprenyl-phosphate 4-deoxy-4-formamido-L-arabinose transferase